MTPIRYESVEAYEAVRRELFPDERRNKEYDAPRQKMPQDGRVKCGGGYRRFLKAGSASQ